MKHEEIFDNRYKIIRTLGKGGMSTVYLAENVRTGGLWAIKEIFKNPDKNPGLQLEFKILKKLNHEALPRIIDIIEDEMNFYIVEDFIEGTTFDFELKNKRSFSEEEVICFATELCEVLVYLHNISPHPVIYRDMKPSNIILTPNGKVKLIDFGIAREYKDESSDDTVYIGTRGYAAPEQYGLGQTSERTDIYNLGMTLHHLITGKNPNDPQYEYKPIRQFNSELSYELERIIEKSTAGDPDERFQSVEEIQSDLLQINNEKREKTENQPKREPSKSNLLLSNYRKLVLSCFGSGEFATEFSYVLAKTTGIEVLLINMNFEKQKIDLYLNLVPAFEKKLKDGTDFGMSQIRKATERKQLNADAISNLSVRAADLKNLHVLIDPFDCKNAFTKTQIDIEPLLKAAYKYYDAVIISHEDITDCENTKIALEQSDLNIVALPASIDVMREYWEKIKHLGEKYDIQKDKNKFVAFEYKENINLSSKNIKKFVGKGRYIGNIKYSSERERFRNIDSVFAQRYFNEIKEEYLKILENN